MFRFENLEVWQEAMNVCERVDRLTQSFPSAEQYGMTAQVRRSAVSISANIAEGAGRSTDGDFARFLDIASGSLMETVSHLPLAQRLVFLNENLHETVYAKRERLGKKLTSFRSRLRLSQ